MGPRSGFNPRRHERPDIPHHEVQELKRLFDAIVTEGGDDATKAANADSSADAPPQLLDLKRLPLAMQATGFVTKGPLIFQLLEYLNQGPPDCIVSFTEFLDLLSSHPSEARGDTCSPSPTRANAIKTSSTGSEAKSPTAQAAVIDGTTRPDDEPSSFPLDSPSFPSGVISFDHKRLKESHDTETDWHLGASTGSETLGGLRQLQGRSPKGEKQLTVMTETDKDIKEIFDLFDREKRGAITLKSFRRIVKELNYVLTPAEELEIFNAAQYDAGRGITFEDFQGIMQNSASIL